MFSAAKSKLWMVDLRLSGSNGSIPQGLYLCSRLPVNHVCVLAAGCCYNLCSGVFLLQHVPYIIAFFVHFLRVLDDCHDRDQLQTPTLVIKIYATFTIYSM